MFKRLLKIVAVLGLLLVIVVVGAALWLHSQLTGSLAQLDGQVTVETLAEPVTVERDNLGIVTLRGKNRADVAFALGFVHAQDRFFQMDLLRRNSAGELAELVGPKVVDTDKRIRLNRFRDKAQKVFAAGTDEDKLLLNAYAQGVNAGLKGLKKKPFEYLLLGLEPAEWKPEDSALVMFSMFLDLQGTDFRDEATLAMLHDNLPGPMFEFLAPLGTEWDAPIQGDAFATPPVPAADVFDTRKTTQVARNLLAPCGWLPDVEPTHYGSNNWAVAGSRTKDGRAIVADDMHLRIRVPHIWYRASMVWPSAEDPNVEQRMTGVSLPGTPAIVVGSNGHVAWGFTNAEGDWVDVVIVEVDPNDKDSYLTPDGPRKFEKFEEIIKVSGQPDEKLQITSTIWGPIVDTDQQGRPRAIRWVAHDTDGVNMGLIRMETARTLDDALRLANLSGSPAQNFVVADMEGRIAWTILGRIPKRVGFDGRLPSSWADGSHRWDGYLTPEEYPKVVAPESGQIWTANARVVSGEMLAKLGDGGYDLGARAMQIRDGLTATKEATEADMLRIQLDDRAVFLERWRKLLLDTLTDNDIKDDPRRAKLREMVDNWGGRAAVDSVGFRAVRTFRRLLLAQLSDVLVNPCKKIDPKFTIGGLDRTEGPIWRLVSEQPEHLIDPRYESWHELLLSAADEVIATADKEDKELARFTWGRWNTTKIQHPLSLAVPQLAEYLDMPGEPLSGDTENMPRIQGPAVGASQRMAVSPGHEDQGYMHMPCGQSGHPLSPHYGDMHSAWTGGKASPFLPGKAMHTLTLNPKASPKPATESSEKQTAGVGR